MAYEEIIAGIDSEISRLQYVRRLLSGLDKIPGTPTSSGRPKRSASKVSATVQGKRAVSAEGKARMAEAQEKRWAAKRRADKKAAKEVADAGE